MKVSSNLDRSSRMSLVVAFLAAAGVTVASVPPASAQDEESTEETSEQKQKEEQSGEQLSDREREVGQLIEKAQKAYHSGQWYEAQMRYEDAYDDAPDDSTMKVHAAVGLSSLLWQRGDYAPARKFIDEALELAKKLDMSESIGRLLLTRGHIQASQGQLKAAERTLKNCVTMANDRQDKVFGPLCQLNWRLTRKMQGEKVGPESDYRKTISELQSNDTPLTAGMALSKTAGLYAKSGRMDRAFELLGEADKQYSEAGSVPAKARNKLQYARLLQESGRWTEARSKLKGLAKKFRQMGSKPALVQTLGLLGNDASNQGKMGVAHKYYTKSLKVAEATGSPRLTGKARLALCDLSSKSPKLVGSEQCENAASTFKKTGMPRLEAKAWAALGRRLQSTEELSEARKAYVRAVEVLREQVHASLYGDTLAHNLANLCQVEMQLEADKAYGRCREARDAIEEAGIEDPGIMATMHYALGMSAARADKSKEALEQLDEAIELYESPKIDEPTTLADALLREGVLHREAGRLDEAEDAIQSSLETTGDGDANRPARVQILIQYAQVLMDREKWEPAVERLEALIEDARKAGDPGIQAWAWNAVARAKLKLDDKDGAEKALRKGLPLAKEAGDDALVGKMEDSLEQFE